MLHLLRPPEAHTIRMAISRRVREKDTLLIDICAEQYRSSMTFRIAFELRLNQGHVCACVAQDIIGLCLMRACIYVGCCRRIYTVVLRLVKIQEVEVLRCKTLQPRMEAILRLTTRVKTRGKSSSIEGYSSRMCMALLYEYHKYRNMK